MKTLRALSSFLLGAMLAVGCTQEDIIPAGSAEGTPTVHFTLGGAAAGAVSRADDDADTKLQTADESSVKTVLAVLYDLHGGTDGTSNGFYKAVTAMPDGDGYNILVEDDGTYDIYLVANPGQDIISQFQNLAPGTPSDDPDKGLTAIVAAQAPDVQGDFLMLSTYAERVTTSITKTYSIGEVNMQRLAARFDIVNGAEGVNITKVTFNNRAVKSSLATPNMMPHLLIRELQHLRRHCNLDSGNRVYRGGSYQDPHCGTD